VEPSGSEDLSVLGEPEEASVAMLLDEFGERIASAAEACEPYLIALYLLDLASAANRFYNVHRVIGSGEPLESARLVLSWAVKVVLGRGLGLLGLVALEEM
jgi:arginyl-tRNA synthetase